MNYHLVKVFYCNLCSNFTEESNKKKKGKNYDILIPGQSSLLPHFSVVFQEFLHLYWMKKCGAARVINCTHTFICFVVYTKPHMQKWYHSPRWWDTLSGKNRDSKTPTLLHFKAQLFYYYYLCFCKTKSIIKSRKKKISA